MSICDPGPTLMNLLGDVACKATPADFCACASCTCCTSCASSAGQRFYVTTACHLSARSAVRIVSNWSSQLPLSETLRSKARFGIVLMQAFAIFARGGALSSHSRQCDRLRCVETPDVDVTASAVHHPRIVDRNGDRTPFQLRTPPHPRPAGTALASSLGLPDPERSVNYGHVQ